MMFALALAAASTTTYSPVGKWTLDYQQDLCMLTRTYSAGGATVSLGFRQAPGDAQTEAIVLFADHPDDQLRRSVVVMGSGAPTKTLGNSVSQRLPGGRQRLLRFITGRDAVAALASETSLTIDEGGQPAITFALGKPVAPLRALATCESDQMRSWGVDVAQMAVPAKPIGDVAKWFAFPLEAAMNRQGGDTTVRWMIDTHGAVTDCIVVRSNGNVLLDAAACKQITRRGRYEPAIGKDGKPMPWMETRHLIWSLG